MSFPPESPTDLRRHELLSDVAEHAAQRLIEKHDLDEDTACDIGNSLADFLAEHWKGQSIYMPGDQPFKLNARDWEIFRRFERGNANDLAKEFNRSKVRIHQIYKRCLAEYRARTQGGLFDVATDESNAQEDGRRDRASKLPPHEIRGDPSGLGRPPLLPDRRFPLQDEFSPPDAALPNVGDQENSP